MFNILLYTVGVGFLNDILGYLWGDAIAFLLRLWILGISVIIMFIYVKNKKWKLKSLLGCYMLFIFVFEKTFMLCSFGLAQFPNFSYNPDIVVAWVIIVPVSFIVFIIIGLLFDYTKNKRLRNNKKSRNE